MILLTDSAQSDAGADATRRFALSYHATTIFRRERARYEITRYRPRMRRHIYLSSRFLSAGHAQVSSPVLLRWFLFTRPRRRLFIIASQPYATRRRAYALISSGERLSCLCATPLPLYLNINTRPFLTLSTPFTTAGPKRRRQGTKARQGRRCATVTPTANTYYY